MEPSPRLLTHWAVAGVLVLSLALTITVGSLAGINYDGWWHLFVARQDAWSRFLAEIAANPHPPLYHLLLKASASLGSERLTYRLVGIAATAGSVLLVVRITQQLFRSRAVILLASLAFGTAITTVTIANEVRSYALAGMFVLAALLLYLRMLSEEDGPGGSSILLALALAAGVLSHYAVLLLLPLLAILPLLLGGPARRRPRRLLLALAPATALGLGAPGLHSDGFSGPMAYMPAHYYSGEQPLWEYAGRVVLDELKLLAPIPVDAVPAAAVGLAAALVAAGMLALLARLRTRGERAPAALLLLYVGLVVATFLASLFGRYPFGGLLRHQYFVFLLGLLAFFLLLDRMIDAVPSTAQRSACVGLLSILIVGTGIVRWQGHEIDRVDWPSEQYRQALQHLPRESDLLVRRTSLIHVFAHHHRSHWRFVRRIPDTEIEKWRVEAGTQPIILYRRLGGWLLHLDDPETHRDVRALLEGGEAAAITTLEVRHGGTWSRGGWVSPRQHLEKIRALAREYGLGVSNVRLTPGYSVARFELDEPARLR